MKIFSEFDESQCLWLLDFSLDDRSSFLIILQENFLLSNPSFMVVTPCLECIAYQWFFCEENYLSEFEVDRSSQSSVFAENACRYVCTAQ